MEASIVAGNWLPQFIHNLHDSGFRDYLLDLFFKEPLLFHLKLLLLGNFELWHGSVETGEVDVLQLTECVLDHIRILLKLLQDLVGVHLVVLLAFLFDDGGAPRQNIDHFVVNIDHQAFYLVIQELEVFLCLLKDRIHMIFDLRCLLHDIVRNSNDPGHLNAIGVSRGKWTL